MTWTPRRTGPDRLHVLVAGGGVGALEAAFALRALAGDLVSLELLTPEPRFFYNPQAVFEPFGGIRVQSFELASLASALEAHLTLGRLASVSPGAHVVRTNQGLTLPYDVLVVACGALPRPALRGPVTFRGPADSDRVAAIARDANRGDLPAITIAIPTPRTWLLPLYELAFGLRDATRVRVTIATVEPTPAAALGQAGSAYLAELIARHAIELRTDVDFERHPPEDVTLAAPELSAGRIYGIPADESGFIPTNCLGAVHGVPDVYAVGDITSYAVKHGSLAAAQADTAAGAIAARVDDSIVPKPFKPILHARLALGRETVYVRRDLGDPGDPGTVSPEPLWHPAAKIFARYLAPALAEISRASASDHGDASGPRSTSSSYSGT